MRLHLFDSVGLTISQAHAGEVNECSYNMHPYIPVHVVA